MNCFYCPQYPQHLDTRLVGQPVCFHCAQWSERFVYVSTNNELVASNAWHSEDEALLILLEKRIAYGFGHSFGHRLVDSAQRCNLSISPWPRELDYDELATIYRTSLGTPQIGGERVTGLREPTSTSINTHSELIIKNKGEKPVFAWGSGGIRPPSER